MFSVWLIFPIVILQGLFFFFIPLQIAIISYREGFKVIRRKYKIRTSHWSFFFWTKEKYALCSFPIKWRGRGTAGKDEDSLVSDQENIRWNQKEIGPAEVAHALSDSPGKPLSPSDFCASLSHRGSGVTWRSPEFPCQALFGFVLFCFKEQKLWSGLII